MRHYAMHVDMGNEKLTFSWKRVKITSSYTSMMMEKVFEKRTENEFLKHLQGLIKAGTDKVVGMDWGLPLPRES
jgi:hypothetical protein